MIDITFYKADHRRYGGRVYLSDFDTDFLPTTTATQRTMSDVAGHIISDWKFDKHCRKAAINAHRFQNVMG